MVEIVNPQDAVRVKPFTEILEEQSQDAVRAWLDGVRDKWLGQCGSCDGGLAMDCTCPAEDPRAVIFELWQLAQYQLDKVARLERVLACPECGAQGSAPCVVKGTTKVRSLHMTRTFLKEEK
jgi:hypothetical protein